MTRATSLSSVAAGFSRDQALAKDNIDEWIRPLQNPV